MKLSWSHKLFFKINSHIGKNRVFDAFAFICAYGLIYVLAVLVFFWGAFVLAQRDVAEFIVLIKLFITAFVFAEMFSYGIALVWRHPRPIIEFPDTKLLLHPIENWKSFPSDHTIVATMLAFVPIGMEVNIFFSIFLIVLALLIMCGRVYVGVHYPRDIIGGVMLGLFFSFSALWLLEHVTQPIFDFIKILVL